MRLSHLPLVSALVVSSTLGCVEAHKRDQTSSPPLPQRRDFIIDVDPAAGTAKMTITGASTTLRGVHTESNLIQNGTPGGPVDSFEMVTTNPRLEGEGDCVAGQNCFDVTVNSFYDTETFDEVYMQIDTITPGTGRAFANGDPPPAGSGLGSMFGGRLFGTIGPGASVTRDVRLTVPGSEPYRVTGRLFHRASTSLRILGASPFQNSIVAGLMEFDPATGAVVANQIITLPGETVSGCVALTTRASDRTVWAILKVAGGRVLATIDPDTAVATQVGALNTNFSSIAFDGSGALWAVVGDGGSPAERLFTLNTTNAAATPRFDLGNGADGEVIAFGPGGVLYHSSGNGNAVFESVDVNTQAVSPIASVGSEMFGMGFDANAGVMYGTSISSDIFTIDLATGARTLIASGLPDDVRGLAILLP